MLDVAALARLTLVDADRTSGMISLNGASCALFADYCEKIASLSDTTRTALEDILPWFLKPSMPFDVGQMVFDHPLFVCALDLVAKDSGISTLIINLHTINPLAMDPDAKIRAIQDNVTKTGKPLIIV